MEYFNKFSVWTVAYNKDGSPNNEVLEAVYDDKDEALQLASRLDGEVRRYDNDTDYDLIRG